MRTRRVLPAALALLPAFCVPAAALAAGELPGPSGPPLSAKGPSSDAMPVGVTPTRTGTWLLRSDDEDDEDLKELKDDKPGKDGKDPKDGKDDSVPPPPSTGSSPAPDPVAPAPGPAPDDDSSSTDTPPAATPQSAPQPQLGRGAVASVVSGTVLVRLPGSTSAIPVSDAAAIPSGSVIDASSGTVQLSSATDAAGHTQAATFRGTTFKMALSVRVEGMVDITLTEAPTGCTTSRFASRSSAARRASSKPVSLWSKDNNGRYRTHGRNSVATVRGTEWTTTETCAGTRTTVTSGAVSVWDKRSGRKVLVRAKKSYLARAVR